MAVTLTALRKRFPMKPPEAAVDHLIIGAGAVGLAIGQQLIRKFEDKSTFIVERHAQAGQETSSRNSEVIHAGIYYPSNSHKTALCLRGRRLLYDYCRKKSIPHKKIGKLIISQSPAEAEYLKSIHDKCQSLNSNLHLNRAVNYGLEKRNQDIIPLTFLSNLQAIDLEPNLSPELSTCLYSPETGIIDSHAFISSLENSICESENGQVVYGTSVVRIDRSPKNDGWLVQTKVQLDKDEGDEPNSVLAKCIINCAGLNAHNIYNHVLYPEARRLQLGFCKGNYYSYTSRQGVDSVKHLIYPVPALGKKQGSFAGLGTHLTLDMNQKIKFGPDVEWLKPKYVKIEKSVATGSSVKAYIDEEIQDFWEEELRPNDIRLEKTYESVKAYLPGIQIENFAPDYCGIRPKLQTVDETEVRARFDILRKFESDDSTDLLTDFFIRQTNQGFINLFGIESPGLTSSLAIGEYVERMIRKEVWGLTRDKFEDDGRVYHTAQNYNSRNQLVSHIGNLNDWA
ncbi:hypothetical protein O181_069993 [Austropuccinia psidii MF-1]|uniref:L-2-hydroxyglutarate dehydrogenase, mitochondrial n=1 Tax=Austropuccinia psidii MF-1 TaxID=1389203 RepID=A0A9Q3F354_9BASI|nr:hypothetical protein [Austropuccinia psidii MF-1]